MSFRKIKNIHFVGIGGIGMSGIAELLLNLKFTISGSDISKSENTERLNRLGIEVTIGHDPKNVGRADVLVYSSAVQSENSELKKARQIGIPVIKRAEMLAELISLKETSIAVGGTHGKTSTSSLIGSILSNCNLDPTLVVGGLVHNLNTNSKLGDGNIIVVEADEYDRSFLALKPTIAIITNIELEHTDCYKDIDDLKNTFLKFCKSVPFYGEVIICIDSPGVREILTKIERPMTTYGKSRDAVYRAENIRFKENKSTYSVFRAKENLGEIQVALPGEHNVLNSLAAITVGLEMGLSFESIKSSLKNYDGVRRRFDIKTKSKNIIVVDDYAHHPTEIRVTLKAAKDGWNRRIIAVFQPHLFSRTKAFFREFAQSLQQADIIFITSIYPAREEPIAGISSELIYIECKKLGHNLCYLVPDFNDIPKKLDHAIQDNDMIITLGAGSIWRFSEDYALYLEKNNLGMKN
tara:strand:- start:22269 stop:23666 length:1398 start_codon:yes stop_codon:yes gene_type:complete